MKSSRIFAVFVLLCFLIPVTAIPWTFDQYGTPKLALFAILSAISLAVIVIRRKLLTGLPLAVKATMGLFIVVQCFQTLRLTDPISGFFGDYGQSESLSVHLGFILIFLASYLLFSSENPFQPFQTSILTATYLICGYGIVEYFLTDPMTRLPVLRVKSLFGDPNSLGVFLILALPVLFWDMASEKRDDFLSCCRFWLSSGAVFLGVANLFLTFSRASWLGFLVVVVIFFPCLLFQNRPNRRLATLLGILIILGIFCAEGLTMLQPKSHSDYELNARIASVTEGNDSGRAFLWLTAWKVFKTAPFTGHGIGTFQDSFHRYETKQAVNHWGPERDLREVHNETLHYLATQGLVGLLSYFGLLFSLGYAVWRNRTRLKSYLNLGSVALISALAGYFIFVQFAYPLIHYTFLFWVYWGILLAEPLPGTNLPNPKKPSFAVLFFIGLIIAASLGFGYRIIRADYLYNRAFAASHTNHYRKSLGYFPEIISQTPWVYQYHYRYAVILIRAARQAERPQPVLSAQYLKHAQSILSRLQKLYPKRFQIPFLLGEIWESRHDYAKANSFYRKSAILFPADYKLWYRIAKTDLLCGDKEKARTAWRTGLKLSRSYMIFSSHRDNLDTLENLTEN